MGSEILRVLIHAGPNPSGNFEPQRGVWQQWQKEAPENPLHEVPWPDSQLDTAYLAGHQPEKIVVGGQMSFACVQEHVEALLANDAVKAAGIHIQISASATHGGYLDEIVASVRECTGIVVGIVE